VTAPTNPLSYNAYIAQIGVMAVYTVTSVGEVNQFTSDANAQIAIPSMLNYAELRIARDMNLLAAQTSNTYTLTASQNVFPLPVDDFLTVSTIEWCQRSGSQVVNSTPLLPTSKEFIQNCYSGLASANTPRYFAMYGSPFGDEEDTATNILFGPCPNYPFSIRITGTSRGPSLYKNASAGIADTEYTYISAYMPDLLVMASMIYISAYQRGFSSTAADVEMAMSYEKQYQILRTGAIQEEDRRKQSGSAWTAYGTPVSATPTR
jgi:hypothetical protein